MSKQVTVKKLGAILFNRVSKERQEEILKLIEEWEGKYGKDMQ